MTDNFKNAQSGGDSPATALASALAMGATTCELTNPSKPADWPAAPYRITFYDATNGDETIRVTDDSSFPVLDVIERGVEGADVGHASGITGDPSVITVGAVADIAGAADAAAVAAHDAESSVHAAAANLIHTTGAESKAGVLTATDKIVANGSAIVGPTYTPGLAFDAAYPKAGIYHAGGNLILFVDNAGTQIAALQIQSLTAQFSVPFSVGLPVIELATYWDGSGSPYTADLTVQPCLTVYTDVAAGQVDIALPDPFQNPGLEFRVIDVGENAATNNIVLTCLDDYLLGTTVEGASSYTINTNGESMLFRADFNINFDNANWKMISRK